MATCDLTNFIESHEGSGPRPTKRRRKCIDLSEATINGIIRQYNRMSVTAVNGQSCILRVPTIFCRDLESASVLSKSWSL